MSKALGVAGLIFVLALALRGPGLGEFMTVDEEQWMLRSGGFWHHLFRDKNTGGTFMGTHPGATGMWLVGAGVVWQENRLGYDIDQSNLDSFRLAATVPIAAASAALIALITWLASSLFGRWSGMVTGVLLASDPYLTGLSQLSHLDALLALFMLVSLLALFLSAKGGQKYLWLGGVFAGLALATKLLPALWLFVFAASWLLINRVYWRQVVRIMGLLLGTAMLTFYVVWPVLWATDDFLRSFERDVPAVVTQEHVALETSENPIEPASFYGRTVLGRTTPFVLILVVGGLVAGLHVWRRNKKIPWVWWLMVYAVGYLGLITFVAKKADRYALPALAVLLVIAGWMFGLFINSRRGALRLGIFFAVAILLIGQVVMWSPYAIAYTNPLFKNIRPYSQQGWGEGLDAAARWLNESPIVGRLTVASWYPGVFGTYFKGKTMSLSSRHDDRVGYVVLYRNMLGRAPDDIASNVLDEFTGKQPVKVFAIQGVPYAAVFEQLGAHYFDKHVGEITGDMEVGQLIPVELADWSAVELAMSNFSSRLNTKDVVLQIKAGPEAADVLREVKINAREIQDSAWQRFEFEPLEKGQYYVSLRSPASLPGDAVTVRFAEEDILPGEFYLQRRARRSGETALDFKRTGDMAYRLY